MCRGKTQNKEQMVCMKGVSVISNLGGKRIRDINLLPLLLFYMRGHLMYPQGCQDVILTRKFTSRVLFKKIIFIHLVVVNLVKFFSNCYGILQKTKFSQTNAYNNFIFIIHCIKMAHPGSTFIYVFKIHLI